MRAGLYTPFIQWNPRPAYGHSVYSRLSRYYSDSEGKLSQSVYLFKESFNTATPLIRTDFCGPLVTGLTGVLLRLQAQAGDMLLAQDNTAFFLGNVYCLTFKSYCNLMCWQKSYGTVVKGTQSAGAHAHYILFHS